MSEWRVRPLLKPSGGIFRVPGDKSIGHRALLLCAIADGISVIEGLSDGADNRSTANAMLAMGVTMSACDSGTVVHGVGVNGLHEPPAALDCGNSGTTMRLLAGLLSAQPFRTTLVGDVSLQRRPMGRVVEPLRLMGARISGLEGFKDLLAPLSIDGGALHGISYDLPVASAQLKSALLLAGLYAQGATQIREPGPSRDHTERMLAAMGVPIYSPRPNLVRLDPAGWSRQLAATHLVIPGDPSSAAFLVVAALLSGTSEEGLCIENVCVNPTRTGYLDVLRQMGAQIEEERPREVAGEPVADLRVIHDPNRTLRAVDVAGDLTVRSIDEIPILAVAAARARGQMVVKDAKELRVKESDRVASIVRMLGVFGVEVEERSDGFRVTGRPHQSLRAGDAFSEGDHRIAMAAAVCALVADGESRVCDVANVGTSFPGFADALERLGAVITVG